ncbi:hypothetical protein [Hwangdonia seohaensis]|uniref:Uncharacterized protein n=1 Tax=Hwangdonia seohaensis TaxID=1240727 RepID=A0ABW3RBC3_9FLAO|nr:hypothetical protein [Hwangdonia seohaensis]
MAENPKNQNLKFKIQVSYEQEPKEKIDLIGFLFNCKGRLLQKQPVRNNELQFSLKDMRKPRAFRNTTKIDDLRLFIAPAADKRALKITTLKELEVYKAYEPIMVTSNEGGVSIKPIPDVFSEYWLYCKCRVTGKISKWFNGGNVWEDKPVCRARVHICEIDNIFYWINKVPDYIITKIPDAILKPERVKKIPIPIPDPPPFQFRTTPDLPQPQPQLFNLFDTTSVEMKRQQITANLPNLDDAIVQKLKTGNANIIREAIVKNYALFHPWFCLWPWWWRYFYRCKELAVVKTNAHGRFDASITYNCFGDKPDIYIWVEYFINGEWTTVYRPPIPCHTHWNYICGTDIIIHITDPRVPVDCCCDCPIGGELVFVRTISKSTSVSHINQNSYLQAPPGQTVPYDRIGLTDASANGDVSPITTAVGDYKRPFGGNPSFYMGFGSDLPNSGIYYYRWSYRQKTFADLVAAGNEDDDFIPLIPLGGEVRKGYDYEYLDSNNDTQIGTNSVNLGPKIVGGNDNLYIIPPQQPDEAPFNVPESNPLWHEQTYNMRTMQFDSTTLLGPDKSTLGGDGLYEFKLELFDQSGNLLSNISRSTFKVPQYGNASFSENAPNPLLEDPTGTAESGGTADAFKILMRFDNESCDADIFTINVNGAPASLDCCGFVNYKPGGVEADLEITFEATHPNNFAVFSFGVVKGTCGGVPEANAHGMVIDSASGYTLSSGIYSKHFTPAELLGECYDNGEGKAAFGQNLRVLTMATDGYSRVKRDAGKSAAFALEP